MGARRPVVGQRGKDGGVRRKEGYGKMERERKGREGDEGKGQNGRVGKRGARRGCKERKRERE